MVHDGKRRSAFTASDVVPKLVTVPSLELLATATLRTSTCLNRNTYTRIQRASNMDQLHIAALEPTLPGIESNKITAIVTLIWPYSSSARQFALLLAEPDFRLRKKKGQVRVRFSGSSARAIATTGIGIGDEVILSLRGAQFVQEGTISTPGKSIDWELSYTQTLLVQVFRNGSELANLEIVNVAPTPAPRSPVRRESIASLSPAAQWTSPAFLKRVRLSDIPLFEAPYDPLATDDIDEGHDKKRRRKSYRDWTAWTYTARTPSPEKDDAPVEDNLDLHEQSPSRPTQLPRTPISPTRFGSPQRSLDSPNHQASHRQRSQHQPNEVRLLELDGTAEETEAPSGAAEITKDVESPRDVEYHELYAGPNEYPPSDPQYAFGGDTEVDTEVSTEEDDGGHFDSEDPGLSTTEANTEDQHESTSHGRDSELAEIDPTEIAEDVAEVGADDTPADQIASSVPEARQSITDLVVDTGHAPMPTQPLTIVMPPPTLPPLQTELSAPAMSTLLTPIGREPSSPTLQPLDSALLPLPSPFPGERNMGLASYLDHQAGSLDVSASGFADADQEPPKDADYILETSFFSSIGSSRSQVLHPDHESAFTPVRFTFGMDGAGWSRPLDLSSPAPEDVRKEATHATDHIVEDLSARQPDVVIDADEHASVLPQSETTEDDRSISENETEAHIGVSADAVPISETEQSGLSSQHELLVADLSGNATLDSGGEPAPSEEIPEPLGSFKSGDIVIPNGPAVVSDVGYPNLPVEMEITNVESPIEFSATAVSSFQEEVQYDQFTYGTSQPSVPEISRATPALDSDDIHPQEHDNHREFVNLDVAKEPSTTHTIPGQTAANDTPSLEILQPLSEDDLVTQLALGPTEDYIQEVFLQDEASRTSDLGINEQENPDADIKMESIEEGSLFHVETQEGDVQGRDGSSDELLIAVPDEGDKMGELHTISVPATGPARNTRSKATISLSPTREITSPQKRNTRSSKSKTSIASASRTTFSPPATRTRSTVSPSQERRTTSPYNLRSQSKLLSPTKSTSATTSTVKRLSSPEPILQDVIEPMSDAGPSRVDDDDPFPTIFEPSQDLDASQGRYSNVSFVKDSEEASLRSEQSISTVRYTDDWGGVGMHHSNLSDPVEYTTTMEQPMFLRPPPASAPEPKTKSRPKPEPRKERTPEIIDITSSSPVAPSSTHSHTSLSHRRLRSAGSNTILSPSKGRRSPSNLPSDPKEGLEDSSELRTPRGAQKSSVGVSYPELPGESGGRGEGYQISQGPSNSQALGLDSPIRSSPPAVDFTLPPLDQRPGQDSNRLLTPEPTQRTTMESQPSFTHQEPQTLPPTPQLTQMSSAGLRSFRTELNEKEENVPSTQTLEQSPVAKSTPRRNVTATDVASTSASPEPKNPSSDVDSDTSPNQPSIGLSTPLAYYTPLKDLLFFLNRSSQFHSAANPDILALVTSSTTTSKRAKKGPKHFYTTLHITDASIYPETTTVQIFRAYQTALPHADAGDAVLLRAFAVKSLNRHPSLISADESAWCVWRYGKPIWGVKRGAYGEVKAREEIKGPEVERGEGEWKEVEKVRAWWVGQVKAEVEEKERKRMKTRSRDKGKGVADV